MKSSDNDTELVVNAFDFYAEKDFFRRKATPIKLIPIKGMSGKHKTSKVNAKQLFVKTVESVKTEKKDLLETIDLAMELKQCLDEININVVSAFQFQLLFIILGSFISIIFNCYYMIVILYKPSLFRLPPREAALFLGYQLLQPTMNILVMVIATTYKINSAKETGKIVNKLILHTKSESVRMRLMEFSHQIYNNMPSFNILGLFSIDGTLLFSIISSTTTYLVILVQFADGEDKSSSNQTRGPD